MAATHGGPLAWTNWPGAVTVTSVAVAGASIQTETTAPGATLCPGAGEAMARSAEGDAATADVAWTAAELLPGDGTLDGRGKTPNSGPETLLFSSWKRRSE